MDISKSLPCNKGLGVNGGDRGIVVSSSCSSTGALDEADDTVLPPAVRLYEFLELGEAVRKELARPIWHRDIMRLLYLI